MRNPLPYIVCPMAGMLFFISLEINSLFTVIPIESVAAPLSITFLHGIIRLVTGAFDDLDSPSARIVVGRNVKVGTGCFELEA